MLKTCLQMDVPGTGKEKGRRLVSRMHGRSRGSEVEVLRLVVAAGEAPGMGTWGSEGVWMEDV